MHAALKMCIELDNLGKYNIFFVNFIKEIHFFKLFTR